MDARDENYDPYPMCAVSSDIDPECSSGARDEHRCVGDTVIGCRYGYRVEESRCRAGEICSAREDDGEALAYCVISVCPCPAGYVCQDGYWCAEDETAPPCSDGCGLYDCVLATNRCATHCIDDADCAIGATCSDGACEA